jgi:pimeloyl-ACP methyl ester carboxylesterase
MAEQDPLKVSAPARRGAVRVVPERRMAWSEWGPADGTPVLFSPGAATSSLLGFATGVVERLGVRLIAVDRPGLGGSDPAAGRTLLDTATDVRALAAALALERPAMVGFSQGAPLALACAAAGAISAVAVVSGTDELAGPVLRGMLPPQVRQLVELAEADPPAAEAMFRGMMTPAMLKEMVRSASPEVDRAVYLEATFAAAFASALDEGFVQGPDGYARDTLLVMQRWPFNPAEIRQPVHLWYGSVDASPFHSLDFGASLARRIPGAARTVVDGAGGSILWTHGTEILESLLEARHRAGT